VKTFCYIVVCGLVLSGATSAKNVNAQEKLLKKLEQEMLMAYVMLDFTALNNVYADEYTNTSYDGTVFTKKQVVEMVKSASLRLDSINVLDSKVKVYGSTAVVSGIRKYHRAGKILGTVRYTEVWVNRNNRWQCVSGQLTSLQERK
jgi:hypothetical protein